MWVGGQRYVPDALPQAKRSGTHCTGGWVCPRASPGECRRSEPPLGFSPWTIQPTVTIL